MGDDSVIRNTEADEDLRWKQGSWDVSQPWVEGSLGPCRRQVGALCRLRWSLRLPYRAASLLELIFARRRRWGWWSAGAFANKGRLEGGQYRAGRRAPPLLHR